MSYIIRYMTKHSINTDFDRPFRTTQLMVAKVLRPKTRAIFVTCQSLALAAVPGNNGIDLDRAETLPYNRIRKRACWSLKNSAG